MWPTATAVQPGSATRETTAVTALAGIAATGTVSEATASTAPTIVSREGTCSTRASKA